MIIEAYRYEIGEAAAGRLRIGRSPVTHNFWVLKNDDGQVVSERHDLATDAKSGRMLVIGLIGSVNRYYTFTPDEKESRRLGVTGEMTEGRTLMHRRQERHTVFAGSDEIVLGKWNAWGALIPVINDLNIPYPPLGLSTPARTVNSNSGYATAAYLMGLEPYYFPSTWNPGAKNLLLPKPLLDIFITGIPNYPWVAPSHNPTTSYS